VAQAPGVARPKDCAVEKLQIKPRLSSFGVLECVLGGEHLEGFKSAIHFDLICFLLLETVV